MSSETGVLRRAASTTRLSHTDSVSNCRCAASITGALVSGETRVLITSVTIVGHSVTQQAPASYPAFHPIFSGTQTSLFDDDDDQSTHSHTNVRSPAPLAIGPRTRN